MPTDSFCADLERSWDALGFVLIRFSNNVFISPSGEETFVVAEQKSAKSPLWDVSEPHLAEAA